MTAQPDDPTASHSAHPQLPAGFDAVQGFVSAWVLPDSNARAAKRQASTMAEIRAFYDAMLAVARPAMDYLSRHRGHVVETRESGKCAAFTCGFHGWTYDLAGALRGLPDEAGIHGLSKSSLSIVALARTSFFARNKRTDEEVNMRHSPLLLTVICLWTCLASAPMTIAAEASARASSPTEMEKDAPDWVQLPLSVSKATLARVFAVPPIKTADEFTFTVLVPPRTQLYDPFDIHVVDDTTVWVADDAKSGAIFEVTTDGHVAVLADIKQHAPISLDVAPPSFGKFAGQIYTVAFAKPEKAGGWELPDAITRIDPATGRDTVVCFLPENDAHEPGAGGFFARFGPEHGPFAGKLWVTAASNHTLYQVTPDGACTPFLTVDLAKWGSPRGIGFTPDGETMLLGSAAPTPGNRAKTIPGGGRILRVSAAGTITPQPFVNGLHEPGAMAFAPQRFGRFAGELFISDAGDWNNEVEATERVPSDGRVYRVTPQGELVLVASGLANPVGVAFAGDSLLISDINGDFHIGAQKFADGFMVMIKVR